MGGGGGLTCRRCTGQNEWLFGGTGPGSGGKLWLHLQPMNSVILCVHVWRRSVRSLTVQSADVSVSIHNDPII